jgi:hypothetical protein
MKRRKVDIGEVEGGRRGLLTHGTVLITAPSVWLPTLRGGGDLPYHRHEWSHVNVLIPHSLSSFICTCLCVCIYMYIVKPYNFMCWFYIEFVDFNLKGDSYLSPTTLLYYIVLAYKYIMISI